MSHAEQRWHVTLSLLVKVKPQLSWPARKDKLAAYAGLACKLWFKQVAYTRWLRACAAGLIDCKAQANLSTQTAHL